MKAIGYIRVSTEDQAREGISLDNQEAKIKDYASLNDMNLVKVIRDEGISGKSLDREGMKELLGMVEAGTIEAIIVYKLDRLSRKTIDTLNLIQDFEDKGIAFHSISEKVDTKSATGKFFLTIVSAIAQMERDLIAERTKDALNHKKVKGEYMGRLPYGFSIDGKGLIENPDEMKIIEKAKRMKKAGKSIRSIARVFNISRTVADKIVNTNLKSYKGKYIKGFTNNSGIQTSV